MIETQIRPALTAPARSTPARWWWLAPAAAAAVWVTLALLILAHRVFVSNDALSNYAHVWYVAQSLRDGPSLPLHMPVLNHGEGFTFPYGAPPWIAAALLWQVLGEWSVTLLLVAGVVVATLAALRWQPELRQPLLLALFLLNPFFVETALLAQFPFLWAAVCFFMGAAALRRRQDVQAALWLALAQFTHPAVMLPPVFVLAVAYGWRRDRRLRVAVVYAVSLIMALPSVWLTLATPAISENGPLSVLANYCGTIGLRALVLVAPPLIVRFRCTLLRHQTPAALGALVLLLVVPPLRSDVWAIKQLVRRPSETAVAAVHDPSFEPGAVYRVLDAADGKMSMYRVLRAGAVLDSDFFPESINRRSWSSPDAYQTFLRERDVRYVLITPTYDRDFRTNEHDLLRTLASQGHAELVFSDSRVEVYRVG